MLLNFLKTKNAAHGAVIKEKFSTYFKVYSSVAVLNNDVPEILALFTQRKDTTPTTIPPQGQHTALSEGSSQDLKDDWNISPPRF